jgi:hypothetical protein
VDEAGARGQQLPDDDAAVVLLDDLELDGERLAFEADESRQGGTGANAGHRGEEDGIVALERRYRPCRATSERTGRRREHLRGDRVCGEGGGDEVVVDHVKQSRHRRP